LEQIQAEIYATSLVFVINFCKPLSFSPQRRKGAKKRYFSFAVERTAKEKNQSLRDIFIP
jgi:hypothetical protein